MKWVDFDSDKVNLIERTMSHHNTAHAFPSRDCLILKHATDLHAVNFNKGKTCRITLQFAPLSLKPKVLNASLHSRSRCFWCFISHYSSAVITAFHTNFITAEEDASLQFITFITWLKLCYNEIVTTTYL